MALVRRQIQNASPTDVRFGSRVGGALQELFDVAAALVGCGHVCGARILTTSSERWRFKLICPISPKATRPRGDRITGALLTDSFAFLDPYRKFL